MKTYSFIAAFVICILFASCSNDDTATVFQHRSTTFYSTDTYDLYSKEGDTLNEGEPIPPKGKDE